MELRQIKELMALMGKTSTKRLKIKQDNFELELEQEGLHSKQGREGDVDFHYSSFSHEKSKARTLDIPPSLHPPVPHEQVKEEPVGQFITSPMVGTFYPAASPDEPSFVKVGDQVEKDTVVCIIEAMKVMNEVKAGVKGTIKEILLENAHPVEFGTKLFKVS